MATSSICLCIVLLILNSTNVAGVRLSVTSALGMVVGINLL